MITDVIISLIGYALVVIIVYESCRSFHESRRKRKMRYFGHICLWIKKQEGCEKCPLYPRNRRIINCKKK